MSAVTRRGLLRAGLAAGAFAAPSASFASTPSEGPGKPLKFQLGIVTYNIAAAWDLPTILRVCKNVGLSPVELRTTHKHGVEPSLNSDQRRDVKARFADAGVGIWGCGSVCEFQSPDQTVV